MKKRLFITTGQICIINAMTIIEMDNRYENTLVIASRILEDEFVELCNKLILPNYFSKVIYSSSHRDYENKEFLNEFSVIYTTNAPTHNFAYLHSDCRIMEEGLSSYCQFFDPDIINGGCLRNYLGKVLYMNPKQKGIIEQDKTIFRNLIGKICTVNNWNYAHLKKEKQILLLSTYLYNRIWSEDKVTDFYNKHIDTLLSFGYSVLFKPHPRIGDKVIARLAEKYAHNPKVSFLFERVPVEIMLNTMNVCAIVSSMSGGGISCADLYNIPAFGFGTNIIGEYQQNRIVNFLKLFFINYIPHVKEMKIDNITEIDDETIKQILNRRCREYLKNAKDMRYDEDAKEKHCKYVAPLYE